MNFQDADRPPADLPDEAFGTWLGERVRGGATDDDPVPRDAIWQVVGARVVPVLRRGRRNRVTWRVVRRAMPALAAAAVLILAVVRYGPWTGSHDAALAGTESELAIRVATLEREIRELEQRRPAMVATLPADVRISVAVLSEAIQVTRGRALGDAGDTFDATHLLRLLAMKRRILEQAVADRWSAGAM